MVKNMVDPNPRKRLSAKSALKQFGLIENQPTINNNTAVSKPRKLNNKFIIKINTLKHNSQRDKARLSHSFNTTDNNTLHSGRTVSPNKRRESEMKSDFSSVMRSSLFSKKESFKLSTKKRYDRSVTSHYGTKRMSEVGGSQIVNKAVARFSVNSRVNATGYFNGSGFY